MTTQTLSIEEAAIIGYEQQHREIGLKIKELKRRLNLKYGKFSKPRRHISPEGRARIAAAQRKRWRAQKRAANA